MASLVVVHAERVKELEKGITEKIKDTLAEGSPIYILETIISKHRNYLSSFSSRTGVIFISPYITGNPHKMIKCGGREYKGRFCLFPQFLKLKKQLLEDNISEVNLSGIARTVCIEDIYRLLSLTDPRIRCYYDDYVESAVYLGIDNKEFEKIYKTPISCKILEDLCRN